MSFFSALAASFGLGRLMAMLGPTLPVERSGFRKRNSRGRRAHRTYGHPPNFTGWWRQRARLQPIVITERMLLRHGWYRRKLRKQGVAIDLSGKNKVALSRPQSRSGE